MVMEAHLPRHGAKGSMIKAPLGNQTAGFEPAPSIHMGLQAEVTGDLDSDADDVRQRLPTSQLDPGTFDMRSTST